LGCRKVVKFFVKIKQIRWLWLSPMPLCAMVPYPEAKGKFLWAEKVGRWSFDKFDADF